MNRKFESRLQQRVNPRGGYFQTGSAHVALDADHKIGVDVDGAEVVDQDRDSEAVIASEDAIEKRGLSRPKEAREDGEWNHVSHNP